MRKQLEPAWLDNFCDSASRQIVEKPVTAEPAAVGLVD